MIRQLRSELFTFLLALQFLTRIPVTLESAYSEQRMAASVRYYPVVGMLIGALAATVYTLSLLLFPQLVAVLISSAVIFLVTGAFHEDGLADTADGIGGGLTASSSLEIMRDSRIGTYGLLAVLSVLSLKIAALTALPESTVVVCIVAAHGLSRWSSVLVIASSRYVRAEGTGKPTAGGISAGGFVFASVAAAFCLLLVWVFLSPMMLLGCGVGLALGHLGSRLFYERKIGGYSGDCLGATQQISELGIYLGVLACL
ncbi:MAG: adenosylcobinamide-GDP ribazoletransferase [Pseudomonadota bacterium]